MNTGRVDLAGERLVVGSYASPYVRKVLVALELLGAGYTVDPIVPFLGNDAFEQVSPLRRVPVLIEDGVPICDSTVIGEYLADRFPAACLLPPSPAARAHARWIEEYCDSRLGEAIVWKLFFQRVIGPGVWRQTTDQTLVQQALEQDLPSIMAWVEQEAPTQQFLFGALPSLADIAIGCFMRTAALARWEPDAAKWPKAAGWISRVLALDAFQKLMQFEQIVVTTPPALVRKALAAAGAPIAETTFQTETPQRGVLTSGAIA